MTTPDLSDKFPDISFINLQFKNFGSEGFYSGKVETVSCPDDNSKVKKILSEPGENKILIVDGHASTKVALLGDQIAKSAEENNWKAIIINGCVRDVEELKKFKIGIFALGSVPKKSEKKDRGSIDAPIEIDGLIINSNDWVYGDSTGVLVSKVELAIGVEPTTY